MKIGDKVIITGNETNYFNIGEIVTIIDICDDNTIFAYNMNSKGEKFYQWVMFEDIKMEDE